MNKPALTFDQLPEAVYNLCRDVEEIKRLLLQRPSASPTKEETPLNAQQAADFLNISKQTVYQNTAKIPHRKRHGRLYFFKTELENYLNH